MAVTVVMAGAATAFAATPAHARTPGCDSWGWFWPGNSSYTSLKLPVDEDTGVAYGEWRCLVRYGNYGDDVRTLQDGLNLCYGTYRGTNLGIRLAVDGQFGPATKAALIKVQKHHRIYADGVYGPETAATIMHRGHAWSPYGSYWVCSTVKQAGVD